MVHLKQKQFMELFKDQDILISAISPNHDMAHAVECYKTPKATPIYLLVLRAFFGKKILSDSKKKKKKVDFGV